jgi:hypothetical protein
VRCPQCQHLNSETAKFCAECGESLTGKAKSKRQKAKGKNSPLNPQHPISSTRRSNTGRQTLDVRPVSYTPRHLAERILAEREAMAARGAPDGERKTITALFADLKGSTALIEDLDPEEARRIIDPTLRLMMDAVHRYEGYVAQSFGDGVFALFGAPIAHEDHAHRKNYFQLGLHDDERQRQEKITGRVLTLDRSLEDIAPYLLFLLGIAEPTSPLQQMDPQIRRRRTLEAIKRLLVRESLNQPLIVIFEDLHWLDAETQAFLQLLSEAIPTARILLLVNYRPEYQHAWGGKTFFSPLRLDPLGEVEAEEMLAALLDEVGATGRSPLRQFILEKTEGNPFFREEIVQQAEDDLLRQFSHLQTGEFIYERPAFPDIKYIFKHALTQEVSYNSLKDLQEAKALLEELGR